MGRAAADGSGRVYSSRKIEYKEKVVRMLQEYSKVLIVNADNVGSDQMHQIRKALRKQAEVLMGKNTMIRYVIKEHAAETKNLALNKLAELVRYNIGLVFTNGDLSAVRDVLVANKVHQRMHPPL
jgi:large subunit ribosomal protein LP0